MAQSLPEQTMTPALDKGELAASGRQFYITGVNTIDTQYGPKHRLDVTLDTETGEASVIMLGSNAGTDRQMETVEEFLQNGEMVGPLLVSSVPSKTKGRNAAYVLRNA